VGAHPYNDPSAFGRLVKAFMGTTAGLALRSTPRAVPLVALGVALLLGVGVDAVSARLPRYATAMAAVAVALVVVNLPSLFTGRLYTESLLRPDEEPAAYARAVAALDAERSTRVYELPGIDFAQYRWGGTVDPVTPGLTDRPYLARELVPWGSPAGADLLIAYERRLQEGWFEPDSLAPFARLISAGEVLARNDLEYERYFTPRPRPTWSTLTSAPGLGAPVAYGPPTANRSIERLPLLDELQLGLPDNQPDAPPVASFAVPGTPPIVRAATAESPVVLAGSGDGLVDAAAAGVLDGTEVVLYSADLASRPELLAAALDRGAHLVVTDSNRRRGQRWGAVRENSGATEVAGEQPLEVDPIDNRLAVFPDAGDDQATVVERSGVRRVQATGYGNPVTYTPEDRPAMALDGDPLTAWRAGAFSPVEGERIVVELDGPVTTDHLTLLQPITGPRNRWITQARLTFDGRDHLDVPLDETSRTEPGQRIDLGNRTFRTVELEITGDTYGKLPGYKGLTSVGLAELAIPGVTADEVVRVPTTVLAAAADGDADHRVSVVLTRLRSDPSARGRSDEELALRRVLALPAGQTFTLAGTARLDGRAADGAIDAVLGASGVTATSTGRLLGSPGSRAAAAVDGDLTTRWVTPMDDVVGQAVTVTAPTPVTVDHLDLQLVADGRFSVPTELEVSVDGGTPVPVALAAVADDTSREGATVAVRADLPVPLTGRSFTVRIAGIRENHQIDYFSGLPMLQPAAIAEVGLPGVIQPVPSGRALPGGCRDDLVRIDGEPVAVRVEGSVGDALARRPLSVTACGGPVRLGPGDHEITTATGRDLGLDVDRLVLDTDPAGTRGAGPATPEHATDAGPQVTILGESATSYDLRVEGATEPFWLVLGQSQSDGWEADVRGRGGLGRSVVVNGYANGWLVEPTADGSLEITLRWTPQRLVWIGLALSAVAVTVCLVLAVLDPGRRDPGHRRRRPSTAGGWVEPALDTGREPSPAVGRRGLVALPPGAAVLFWFLGGWLPALSAAAVGFLALWRPSWRRVLVWVPPAFLGATAVYVVAKLLRYDLPPTLDWPNQFEVTHAWGWAAVATAATLAVAGALLGRRDDGRLSGPASSTTAGEGGAAP
jgi:arabinofuranan 3-O-arabinosyltransferase